EGVAPAGVGGAAGAAAACHRDVVGAGGGGEVGAVPALARDRVLDRDLDRADPVAAGRSVVDGAGDSTRPAGRVIGPVRREHRRARRARVVDEGAGGEVAALVAVAGGVGCLDLDGVGVAVGECAGGEGVAPAGVGGAAGAAAACHRDVVGAGGGGEVGAVP